MYDEHNPNTDYSENLSLLLLTDSYSKLFIDPFSPNIKLCKTSNASNNNYPMICYENLAPPTNKLIFDKETILPQYINIKNNPDSICNSMDSSHNILSKFSQHIPHSNSTNYNKPDLPLKVTQNFSDAQNANTKHSTIYYDFPIPLSPPPEYTLSPALYNKNDTVCSVNSSFGRTIKNNFEYLDLQGGNLLPVPPKTSTHLISNYPNCKTKSLLHSRTNSDPSLSGYDHLYPLLTPSPSPKRIQCRDGRVNHIASRPLSKKGIRHKEENYYEFWSPDHTKESTNHRIKDWGYDVNGTFNVTKSNLVSSLRYLDVQILSGKSRNNLPIKDPKVITKTHKNIPSCVCKAPLELKVSNKISISPLKGIMVKKYDKQFSPTDSNPASLKSKCIPRIRTISIDLLENISQSQKREKNLFLSFPKFGQSLIFRKFFGLSTTTKRSRVPSCTDLMTEVKHNLPMPKLNEESCNPKRRSHRLKRFWSTENIRKSFRRKKIKEANIKSRKKKSICYNDFEVIGEKVIEHGAKNEELIRRIMGLSYNEIDLEKTRAFNSLMSKN